MLLFVQLAPVLCLEICFRKIEHQFVWLGIYHQGKNTKSGVLQVVFSITIFLAGFWNLVLDGFGIVFLLSLFLAQNVKSQAA